MNCVLPETVELKAKNLREAEIAGTVSPSIVLDLVESVGFKPELCGQRVNVNTQSLKKFKKKGTVCTFCGKPGTMFLVHKQKTAINYGLVLIADDGDLLTIDHIIPKSKGGTLKSSNVQILCYPCNQLKADRIVSLLPPI